VSLARPTTRPSTRTRLLEAPSTRLIFDRRPVDDDGSERLEPLRFETRRDLEILRALWDFRFLTTALVNRVWWPGQSLQATRLRLVALHAAGLVDRFRPWRFRGNTEWTYRLAPRGFELLAGRGLVDGGERFRLADPPDYAYVRHELELVAWLLDLRDATGAAFQAVVGAAEATVEPPRQRRLDAAGRLRDVGVREAARLAPDAEVRLESRRRAGGAVRLLVELDRTGRPDYQLAKWRAYDALLAGWWRDARRRGGGLRFDDGEPPRVVFVCPDEPAVEAFLERADGALTAAVERPGRPRAEWEYPGRDGLLFCARGETAGGGRGFWRLDRLPPAARPAGTAPEQRRGEFRFRFGADEEAA
jgi:Replication-relaxation